VANVVNGHPVVRFSQSRPDVFGMPNFLATASAGMPCGAEDERHQRWKSARAVDPWHAAGALYANNDGNLYEDFCLEHPAGAGIAPVPLNKFNLYNVTGAAASCRIRFNGTTFTVGARATRFGFTATPALGRVPAVVRRGHRGDPGL